MPLPSHAALAALLALLLSAPGASAARTTYRLNEAWRFELEASGPPGPCADPNATFPIPLVGIVCQGLTHVPYAASQAACIDACCGDASCEVWQWCESGPCAPAQSCWIGSRSGGCNSGAGWASRARNVSPTPTPAPGVPCAQAQCQPNTDDSAWRTLSLPHDFVVEGNATQSGDMAHGYLPYGVGWYRKHFALPAALAGAVLYLDVEGAQTASAVYLNGALISLWGYGYTPNRIFLNASQLVFGGADNLLAIQVDARHPDGWW